MGFRSIGMATAVAAVVGGAAMIPAFAQGQVSPAAAGGEPDVGIKAVEPAAPISLDWLPAAEGPNARLSGSEAAGKAKLSAAGRRVVVRTSTWVPGYEGMQAVDPVLASARRHPDVSYDVLLVAEPDPVLRTVAKRAQPLPNVTIRYVFNDSRIEALPERMRSALPSAMTLTDGVVERVSVGAESTERLLSEL